MGLQFENMVLNNRKLVQQVLKIRPAEIVADNPYFQRQTARQKGCQIDYLIQTKLNTLYVCEIKFSKNPIGVECMHAVQEKIKHLKKPKGFSCAPVLIHVSGITEELENKEYFTNIIDFSEFLEKNNY